GFGPADLISFWADYRDNSDTFSTRFENGGTVTPDANNHVRVVENGDAYDLQFDPLQDFSGEAFEHGFSVLLVLGQVSTVISSQNISDVVVASGNIQNVYGMTHNVAISSGGFQNVESGGTAFGTSINSGAYQEVLAGGLDTGAKIFSGGHQIILFG